MTNTDNSYFLIELRTNPPSAPLYYTAPGTWGSAVDLATKFHTEQAASFEAQHLQVGHTHQIAVAGHTWFPLRAGC